MIFGDKCFDCLKPYILHRDRINFNSPNKDADGLLKVKVNKIGLNLQKVRVTASLLKLDRYYKDNTIMIESLDDTLDIPVVHFGADKKNFSMNLACIISIFEIQICLVN